MTGVINPVYGRIVTANDVRERVTQHIALWAPAYTAELARQYGIRPAQLPVFRSYSGGTTNDHWTDEQLPALKVVVAGISEIERRSRQVDFHWIVGIGVAVSGPSYDDTERLAGLYAGVVRGIMTQQPSLGGFASGNWQIDERYDSISEEAERTLIGAALQFDVLVNGVVDSASGPSTPPADPIPDPPGLPVITKVTVNVEKKEG